MALTVYRDTASEVPSPNKFKPLAEVEFTCATALAAPLGDVVALRVEGGDAAVAGVEHVHAAVGGGIHGERVKEGHYACF